jgi:hypothetical protein
LKGDPLLHILGGCDYYDRQDFDRASSDKTDEFLAEIKKHALEPLRILCANQYSQFLGMLGTAESMIKAGRIRCLREFESYAIHLASVSTTPSFGSLVSLELTRLQHLANNQSSFMFLVRSVLSQCFDSSSKMTRHHVYGDDTPEAEEYSINYVSKKMKDEQNRADRHGKREKQTISATPAAIPLSVQTSLSNGTSSTTSNGHSTNSPLTPSPLTASTTDSSISGAIAKCLHEGCGKSYRGRDAKDAKINLSRHERTIHKDTKVMICPGVGCGLEVKGRRDNLRTHFKRTHPKDEMPEWLSNRTRAKRPRSE